MRELVAFASTDLEAKLPSTSGGVSLEEMVRYTNMSVILQIHFYQCVLQRENGHHELAQFIERQREERSKAKDPKKICWNCHATDQTVSLRKCQGCEKVPYIFTSTPIKAHNFFFSKFPYYNITMNIIRCITRCGTAVKSVQRLTGSGTRTSAERGRRR